MISFPPWARVLLGIFIVSLVVWNAGGIRESIYKAKRNIKQMGIKWLIIRILFLIALILLLSRLD